ncbi:MAG: ABC transporter ATP-binding protein [Erysipelotrichaceae bacterium]|nr:ABC transporter ATP-binding protein [Erysipelotrichaceae bacterium]
MKNNTLKKVLTLIKKHWLFLIFSILFSTASVTIQLYIPILFGEAIDCIKGINDIDMQSIVRILQRASMLILSSSILAYFANVINNHISYKVVEDLRIKAMTKIQILPLSYLDKHSSGDLTSRVIVDCEQIAEGLLLGFSNLFAGIITILVTLYFMMSKDPGITLMVFVLTPVSFFVSKFIASRSYKMFSRQNESRGKLSGLVNEFVNNEKMIKAFGYEDKANEKFRVINDELQGYAKMAVFYSSLTNPSTRAVNNVIYALVVLAGCFRILGSTLTVGGLSVLLSYASQYMKPFNDISSVITEFQNSLSCAERVFELIEAKPQSKDGDKELVVDKGEIKIEEVYFSYEEGQRLIEDFNFEVKSGETIAIVGPTGCGKTTLINLLMRFYDVNSGTIAVEGLPINEVTRSSLRNSYGMVLQDTWIRNDSIRNNICFGSKASDEEIIVAAKKTHAYDFIKRMEHSLDTVIDENSLSQGQKQLLCITRAMLSKPKMLILDEATSNIDTRTEIYIQKAFAEMMKDKTSFIVAHRLSTIRNADKIIVMKDGHIIEQGGHEELLKLKGFYYELYNSQFARVE